MKHTPGPWIVDPDMRGLGNLPVAGVRSFDGISIANCGTDGHANARLIAAAPDLLAALQQMMREYECLRFEQPERWPDAATAARAAIAKATGE